MVNVGTVPNCCPFNNAMDYFDSPMKEKKSNRYIQYFILSPRIDVHFFKTTPLYALCTGEFVYPYDIKTIPSNIFYDLMVIVSIVETHSISKFYPDATYF